LTIKFAHRKLDQHIRSLTPSSPGATYSRRIESILGILPIRLSKSTNTLKLLQTLKSLSPILLSDEPF